MAQRQEMDRVCVMWIELKQRSLQAIIGKKHFTSVRSLETALNRFQLKDFQAWLFYEKSSKIVPEPQPLLLHLPNERLFSLSPPIFKL